MSKTYRDIVPDNCYWVQEVLNQYYYLKKTRDRISNLPEGKWKNALDRQISVLLENEPAVKGSLSPEEADYLRRENTRLKDRIARLKDECATLESHSGSCEHTVYAPSDHKWYVCVWNCKWLIFLIILLTHILTLLNS